MFFIFSLQKTQLPLQLFHTHKYGVFEDVLGLEAQDYDLDLEASNSSKLLCPWLKDSTIF